MPYPIPCHAHASHLTIWSLSLPMQTKLSTMPPQAAGTNLIMRLGQMCLRGRNLDAGKRTNTQTDAYVVAYGT